jgi:hypothetical protein
MKILCFKKGLNLHLASTWIGIFHDQSPSSEEMDLVLSRSNFVKQRVKLAITT